MSSLRREPLPDVQRRRPEISAALAAVVERATAKETKNRYATVAEMVHDLEEVLGIEAARAGETSGEATTVLRSLPGDTSDVPPDSVRQQVECQFLGTVWDDLNIWRYQEYIEHPALSKIDAKPYMAMRKWATQFYEVPAPA